MSLDSNVTFSIQQKIQADKERIKNLLVSAFEGGSNYWYCIEKHNKEEIKECEYLSELLSFEGSQVVISDSEGQLPKEGKAVTHLDVLKAWEIFSKDPKYAKHYADVLNENDDADTGDTLLQIAVFGEVIYG